MFKLASVACSSSGVTKLHFILLWRIHCWLQDVLQVIIMSKVEYKTGLPWRNHSWSHCGVNCTCQQQFGTGVIAEQIAQFHLVFLYERLTYFQNTVRNSWVDIWFSYTSSESSAFIYFFTPCFMCFRNCPSFTLWKNIQVPPVPVREQTSPL